MDHTVSRSHSRWLWLEFEDSDLSQQNTNRNCEEKLLGNRWAVLKIGILCSR